MLRIESDGTVKLTRGDTARLTVNVKNETNNKEYLVEAGDTLTLSVKKSVKDEDPAFQKVIKGENTFHIIPKDTQHLAFGKYKYDVQLTTSSGDVYTVIEPKTFEIMEEVTS